MADRRDGQQRVDDGRLADGDRRPGRGDRSERARDHEQPAARDPVGQRAQPGQRHRGGQHPQETDQPHAGRAVLVERVHRHRGEEQELTGPRRQRRQLGEPEVAVAGDRCPGRAVGARHGADPSSGRAGRGPDRRRRPFSRLAWADQRRSGPDPRAADATVIG